MARYEHDTYQQQDQDMDNIPGNPWFICTMWLGQYEIAKAESLEDLEKAVPIMEWVAERSLESGVLAEPTLIPTHSCRSLPSPGVMPLM